MQANNTSVVFSEDVDISISRISSVWHAAQTDWGRPQSAPRLVHGLVFFIQGSIEYQFGASRLLASKGDVLNIPQGIPYSGKKVGDEENSFFVIDFETVSAGDRIAWDTPFVLSSNSRNEYRQAFTAIHSCWNEQSIGYQLACKAKLYQLLASIVSQITQSSNSQKRKATRIKRVAQYIEEHFDDETLCVKDLCARFHISQSQLARSFQKEFSTTTLRYLQNNRINHAANLLRTTSMPIGDVAGKSGFASPYYFCRLFKTHTGFTPGEFRRITSI